MHTLRVRLPAPAHPPHHRLFKKHGTTLTTEITTEALQGWAREGGLSTMMRRLGQGRPDPAYLEDVLGVPHHLELVTQRLAEEDPRTAPEDQLASIPFYSLCKGLFLPLSGLAQDRVAMLFGIDAPAPLDYASREALLETFLSKDIGLTLPQKLGCVLGDPFRGKRSTFQRDSLLRLLQSSGMSHRRELLDRLALVGDVAILFAESRPTLKRDPPLTAAEVLETLRFMRELKRNERFDIMRGVLARCGKLEAYFLAKLLLRRAGFGFDYQGPLLARTLGNAHGAEPEAVSHAVALTDYFHVAEILAREGAPGLKRIQLQPLVPVRPALASLNDIRAIEQWPVWVERKYDGIRLMLHKSTDAYGSAVCGAYTRRRGDWLELVPGLDFVIKALPGRSFVLDGELYGSLLDGERVRPATVYEVYSTLQGERFGRVNLKFAAFDLLLLEGQDLTDLPLRDRRQRLDLLVRPFAGAQLPVPIHVAEGQLANAVDDANRLYAHFRNQGYEGIITKDLDRPYRLNARDPTWCKKKPELTLDLVLLGGVFAVTSKENAGLFGSYVIGARTRDGTFDDVGDVAGVDRVRDMDIQAEIMREGLLTGNRIERASMSGVRAGVELLPHIVVTVRFTGIVKEGPTGALRLRDPKLVHIRSDKSPAEADTLDAIDQAYLRQRMA